MRRLTFMLILCLALAGCAGFESSVTPDPQTGATPIEAAIGVLAPAVATVGNAAAPGVGSALAYGLAGLGAAVAAVGGVYFKIRRARQAGEALNSDGN